MAVLKGSSQGLARDLPISIVESDHILLLSNEMLYELAMVLRYPRMLALHGLSEKRIYDYVGFLREAAEIVIGFTNDRGLHDDSVVYVANRCDQ